MIDVFGKGEEPELEKIKSKKEVGNRDETFKNLAPFSTYLDQVIKGIQGMRKFHDLKLLKHH